MRLVSLIFCLVLSPCIAPAADVAATLTADGFDLPVGKPDGEGYYRSRGYRAHGHLGEDWNGRRGGDTDLGAPVYAVAHGVVVFAEMFGHGWGNVVIVRHAYEEGGRQKLVDSLYGHLDKILVRFGQQLRRGQQLGTIGTAGGLYEAHLHLEMRRDIRVGMARHQFANDDSVYWSPVDFIRAHRRLKPATSVAAVPLNTFVAYNGSGGGMPATRGFRLPGQSGSTARNPYGWKPDRYEDIRKPGTAR
jgi:murein DD-endopeptidase MepM/ murein hydrolase activator NlpD